MENILVTGACGQLGTELVIALRKLYGDDRVISSDIKSPEQNIAGGIYEIIDALNPDEVTQAVNKYKITQIYHLAAILSAKGEKNPKSAWNLNMKSLLNVLEISKELKLNKVYWPSSIAVFGPDTPKKNTPQNTVMNPDTVYGISKLAGERWCEYYHKKYNVDVRSIRYPGLTGYKSEPGGGTTDYAVDIFHHALKGDSYECFLKKDTYLPMMYMSDAIRGTLELMQTDANQIKVRSSYNLGAMSFTPQDLATEIQKIFPEFKISYNPDYRQEIADSWPDSIDDINARTDWNWEPQFGLTEMTRDMCENLKLQLQN